MTNEYVIDTERFGFKDEKFVEQMAQFLEERIPDSEIAIEGNIVKAEVPDEYTKRMFKLRGNKFLYQAGLKDDYRLVSLVKSDAGEGYMIVEL